MRKLIKSFNLKSYHRHQIVYNQGDQASFVYIVVNGDFEVVRVNNVRDESRSHGGAGVTPKEVKGLLGPCHHNPGISEECSKAFVSCHKTFSMGRKVKAHVTRVALMNVGQLIGHEDATRKGPMEEAMKVNTTMTKKKEKVCSFGHQHYTTTVKSASNDASLYCCRTEEFHAVMKKDDKTWEMLMEIG